MRFRNSFRLLMENFKQVYRLFLVRGIITLIAIAICCTFVLPEFIDIWRSEELKNLLSDGKELVKTIFSLKSVELENAKAALLGKGGSLNTFLSYLSARVVEISLIALGCLVVYLLKRFVETICYFTIGNILNDKMATYADAPFGTTLVSNLGKASIYAAIYVPTVFIFDVLTILICYSVFLYLPFFMGVYLSVLLIVVLQSVKLTFTGRWMPGMSVDNRKIRDMLFSDSRGLKKQALNAFANYIVTIYLIIIFNIVAAVCTFGSALLITIPTSFFLLICEQFVNYYTEHGKKYFITYERIAKNSDHGDKAHFFDYIVNAKDTTENNEEN